jgi:hypothetical protein
MSGSVDESEGLRYEIRLLIKHPSIDPGFITRRLGPTPQLSQMAGAPRVTPAGMPLPGIYRESCWSCWEQTERHRHFFDSVKKMLDLLEPHAKFLSEIVESNGAISLILHLPGDVNIGDSISPHELGRLSSLGISLGLEVFPRFGK